MKVVFRQMEISDVQRVYEIEKMSFSSPWSKNSLMKEITENKLAVYNVMLDAETNMVIGYYGVWIVCNEGHIMNIAIDAEYRGKGLGNSLIEHLIGEATEKGIERLTLEVRKSNEAAIGLYEKYGFEVSALRKDYYRDVGEDAYIMWLELDENY